MKEEKIKKEFANRFNELSRRNGWDKMVQHDLGKYLGVSGPMVSYYRNGERLPSIETAIRICTRGNESVEWLLLGSGAGRKSFKDHWYSLSVEERARWIASISDMNPE